MKLSAHIAKHFALQPNRCGESVRAPWLRDETDRHD
jgi:hypothetical protein